MIKEWKLECHLAFVDWNTWTLWEYFAFWILLSRLTIFCHPWDLWQIGSILWCRCDEWMGWCFGTILHSWTILHSLTRAWSRAEANTDGEIQFPDVAGRVLAQWILLNSKIFDHQAATADMGWTRGEEFWSICHLSDRNIPSLGDPTDMCIIYTCNYYPFCLISLMQ